MLLAPSSRPFVAAAAAAAALVIVLAAAVRPDDNTEAVASPAVIEPVTTSTVPGLEVAPATADDDVEALTNAAVRALSSSVTRSSHRDALRTAFFAYYSYRDEHRAAVRKPYLYYVDMGLSNRTRRGYVFDMEKLSVVEGPFTVAHGRGSARGRNGVPTTFSNRPGSKATSLGLYLGQETYTFRGKSGGRRYTSVGLRMRGESGSFNSAARRRGIVAHGAPYVSANDAGRSEGCPAMEMSRARRLLPLIANGGVVFIYSPSDERWVENDPWAGGFANSTAQ